jgi:DNA-binding response OmpR family regulator
MYLPHGYILVVDSAQRTMSAEHPWASQLQYPVFVADSAEEAVNQASQVPPCLVILVEDDVQKAGRGLIKQLRGRFHPGDMTILALTDAGSPQWDHYDDIPGLDGLLVKPVSHDIVSSLVESACARHSPSIEG